MTGHLSEESRRDPIVRPVTVGIAIFFVVVIAVTLWRVVAEGKATFIILNFKEPFGITTPALDRIIVGGAFAAGILIGFCRSHIGRFCHDQWQPIRAGYYSLIKFVRGLWHAFLVRFYLLVLSQKWFRPM